MHFYENTEALKQGSGTSLAKGAIKPT